MCVCVAEFRMEETQKLWDFISSSNDSQETSAVAASSGTCRFVDLVSVACYIAFKQILIL